MIKLKELIKESFGVGQLPSEKLMKMKVSAKDMMDSVNPKSVNEVSDSEIKKSIKKKERGGPYTIIVRHGNMSKKVVDHSPKSYKKVEDAIKMYHKYNKKHKGRGVSIEDGYGRTVFMESVNEGDYVNESFSTEEKRIVMMAVRKIAKYMNRDLATALRYVIGAAQELEKSGKVK